MLPVQALTQAEGGRGSREGWQKRVKECWRKLRKNVMKGGRHGCLGQRGLSVCWEKLDTGFRSHKAREGEGCKRSGRTILQTELRLIWARNVHKRHRRSWLAFRSVNVPGFCTIYTLDDKLDFPGGSDGKAPAYDAGDLGSIPELGRPPGEGNSNPLQYSCLENPMDWGAGVAKSWTQLSDFTFFFFLLSWRQQRSWKAWDLSPGLVFSSYVSLPFNCPFPAFIIQFSATLGGCREDQVRFGQRDTS